MLVWSLVLLLLMMMWLMQQRLGQGLKLGLWVQHHKRLGWSLWLVSEGSTTCCVTGGRQHLPPDSRHINMVMMLM